MKEHTKIPWTWGCNGDRSIEDEFSTITIARMSGRGKITKLDEANRNFIIKSVNCHDALVAAVHALMDVRHDTGPSQMEADKVAEYALSLITKEDDLIKENERYTTW